MDFSSPKSTFIEYGGIKQLIELSKSMDPNARCSALRSLRNLMFLADNKRKELFYSEVKAQGFVSLISGKQSPLNQIICFILCSTNNKQNSIQILSPRFKSKLWPSCVILLMDVSTPLSLYLMKMGLS